MMATVFLWPNQMKIILVKNTLTYLSSETYATSD